MKRSKLIQLRALIEKAAVSLDDRDASMSAELYPKLRQDGSLVEAGTRINWNGKVVKAAAALWDRDENDPAHAPALWADLKYREGIRIIPETISAAEAFAQGERGWWGDVLYKSLLAANVYTPAAYPQGWERAN